MTVSYYCALFLTCARLYHAELGGRGLCLLLCSELAAGIQRVKGAVMR